VTYLANAKTKSKQTKKKKKREKIHMAAPSKAQFPVYFKQTSL